MSGEHLITDGAHYKKLNPSKNELLYIPEDATLCQDLVIPPIKEPNDLHHLTMNIVVVLSNQLFFCPHIANQVL